MNPSKEAKIHILYLVRHGESECNATKKLLQKDEDVLTETGKTQASLLGEHLSNESFTRTFSSDYVRAYNTAQLILSKSKNEAVQNLIIKQDERIHERWLGVFENCEIGEILKFLGQKIIQEKVCPVDIDIPEGDTPEKMFHNVESFFSDILKIIDASNEEDPPEKILTVSHGFTLLYLAHHLSRSIEKYDIVNSNESLFKICPNTGFIKMAIEKCPAPSKPRKLEFLKIYETEHLKSLEQEDVLHRYTKTEKSAKQFNSCMHQ